MIHCNYIGKCMILCTLVGVMHYGRCDALFIIHTFRNVSLGETSTQRESDPLQSRAVRGGEEGGGRRVVGRREEGGGGGEEGGGRREEGGGRRVVGRREEGGD